MTQAERSQAFQRCGGAAPAKLIRAFSALPARSLHPWPQLPSRDKPSQKALINRDKQTSKSLDSLWASAQKFRNWLGNTVRIGCLGRRPNILQRGWAINTSRIASLVVFWWYLFLILSGWESKVSQKQKDSGINLQACFLSGLVPEPRLKGEQHVLMALPTLCTPCWGQATEMWYGFSIWGQWVHVTAKSATSCLPPRRGLLPLPLAPDPRTKLTEN